MAKAVFSVEFGGKATVTIALKSSFRGKKQDRK